MKRFKGQNVMEFLLVGSLIIVATMGAYSMMGGQLSNIFKNQKNPKNTFNAGRTMRYENPKDLVSNVTIDVNGRQIAVPIEKVIKENLASGSYIQTSGSAGRVKEVPSIMKEYASQITKLLTSAPLDLNTSSNACAQYKTTLNNYKAVILDTVDLLENADTELKMKIALMEMAVKLSPDGFIATQLKIKYDTYNSSLAASTDKDLLNIFHSDLMNFGSDVKYGVNSTLYKNILGQDYNGTLAQDQALVNKIKTDYTKYDGYAFQINVFPSASYSSLSPNAYNAAALCKTLGGTGNPCHI